MEKQQLYLQSAQLAHSIPVLLLRLLMLVHSALPENIAVLEHQVRLAALQARFYLHKVVLCLKIVFRARWEHLTLIQLEDLVIVLPALATATVRHRSRSLHALLTLLRRLVAIHS